jgi:hypothetical protein
VCIIEEAVKQTCHEKEFPMTLAASADFKTAMQPGGPLAELARAAFDAVERGERAQVIFDLDDTLFLVRPRKRAIFRELAEAHAHDQELHTRLHALAGAPIPYDVMEALATVGITQAPVAKTLKDQFFARFFDGAYTRHDEPNEGAAAYVRHLHARGVQVVYLTGRPEEMMPRTRRTLADHGFPIDHERAALVLKATHESHLGDAEFKGVKAAEIGAWGPVLGVFDNEPANLNAMKAAMADARFFLLDTDHSPNPPALQMDVHVMGTFELERRTLATTLANSPSFKQGGSWTINVAAV